MKYAWGAGAVIAVVLVALLFRFYQKGRPTAEEIERRRRALINVRGKLGDGEIVDVEGLALMYVYSVAGVGYEASQDISALEALLPADRMLMIGPASVKFDPKNPANSIVVCESWSGFRV